MLLMRIRVDIIIAPLAVEPIDFTMNKSLEILLLDLDIVLRPTHDIGIKSRLDGFHKLIHEPVKV